MSKYQNVKTEFDGLKFDSKKEAARYAVLRLLERGNVISELKLQVPFELAPSVVINGRKKPALRYIADFVYRKDGVWVTEDCKGALTDLYKAKRHLMKSVHNIEILET